jgi:hypothetical protein
MLFQRTQLSQKIITVLEFTKNLRIRPCFLRDVLVIFRSLRVQKLSFFFGLSMIFYPAISYDLFFLDLFIRVLERFQGRKSEDFDQNTKNGLNRHFWVLFNEKWPKMMQTNISLWFWDEKNFMVCTFPAPAYFVTPKKNKRHLERV